MDQSNQPVKYAIWDFAGVLVNVDAFRDFLKVENDKLYHQYYVLGATQPKLKKKHKDEVSKIFDDATRRGLYSMTVTPEAAEALGRSIDRGNTNVIFSTNSTDLVNGKLSEFSLDHRISRIVSLDEVLASGRSKKLTKESPQIYVQLSRMLCPDNLFSIETYVDDSNLRVMAAVEADQILHAEDGVRFMRLFHYAPKASESKTPMIAYVRVKDLRFVE